MQLAQTSQMNISYNGMSHSVYKLERAGWEGITAQGWAGHQPVDGEQLYGALLVLLEFYSPLSLPTPIFITITIKLKQNSNNDY